jgi:3-oxoadipate enol-lactonase
VTTVADGRRLVEAITDATLAEVDASHISNIEAEHPFSDHLRRFLAA